MLIRDQQLQDRQQRLHDIVDHLHDKARKCRELADTAMTEEGRSILFELAQHYEHEASTADRPLDKRIYPEAVA